MHEDMIGKAPWSGLTPKEQDIIEEKVKPDEGESARSWFNHKIAMGEGDVKEYVTAIKNFIDVAGGHTNSPVWQLIDSIEQVTGKAGGQPLVHIVIKKDKNGNPMRNEF